MADLGTLFGARRTVTKRKNALTTGVQSANVDTAGLDPEMLRTIGQESVRRKAFASSPDSSATPSLADKIVSFGNNVGHFIEAHNPFAGASNAKQMQDVDAQRNAAERDSLIKAGQAYGKKHNI